MRCKPVLLWIQPYFAHSPFLLKHPDPQYGSLESAIVTWVPGSVTVSGDLGDFSIDDYRMDTFDKAVMIIEGNDINALANKSTFKKEYIPQLARIHIAKLLVKISNDVDYTKKDFSVKEDASFWYKLFGAPLSSEFQESNFFKNQNFRDFIIKMLLENNSIKIQEYLTKHIEDAMNASSDVKYDIKKDPFIFNHKFEKNFKWSKELLSFFNKNGIDYTAFKNGYDVLNVIVRFSYVNIESFEEYQETLRDLDLDIDDVEYDFICRKLFQKLVIFNSVNTDILDFINPFKLLSCVTTIFG